MSRVTIMDVAQRAGVSHATVARVMRNNGYVSEEAAEKVQNAIRELGYVPNRFARGLKSKKSGLICHLGVLSGNRVYERLSAGMADRLDKNGYALVNMPIIYDGSDSVRVMEELDQIPFEGIVSSSIYNLDAKALKRFTESPVPLVMVERGLDTPGVDEVVFDDYCGVKQAVTYLHSCGCKKMAFVGLSISEESMHPLLMTEKKRLLGYNETVQQFGAEPVVESVTAYDRSCGYQAAENLVRRVPNVDGIYAASDTLLSGILQYIEAHSQDINHRIRVVGTDNSLAQYLPSPMPSLEFDYDRAAQEAVRLLLERIENPKRERQIVKLPTKLNLNGFK